jgi:uncharacterized repeat protein (TIGR03803 family)
MRAVVFVVFAIVISGCARGSSLAPTLFLPDKASGISTSIGYRTLYSFAGSPDGARPATALVRLNGTLYGTTVAGGQNDDPSCHNCGTVYSVTPTGPEMVLYRFPGSPGGGAPEGDLVAAHGAVYGTTVYGGTDQCAKRGCGTVYTVSSEGDGEDAVLVCRP